MAKKRAGEQMAFDDPETGESMEPEIPQELSDLADAYDKAHTAKSKATGKFNTADANLKEKMKELGISTVPIRNGAKRLQISTSDKIKYLKPKAPPTTTADDDDDDDSDD